MNLDLDWDDAPKRRRREANQEANLLRQAEATEKARIAREKRRAANRAAFASRKRRATLSARSSE